ncbi:AI-2E family transporter [Haloparvum sedimenti]|uniref:AI-2E family transporter n=1 Tax=Haloparvum sedimenti TaxID=1678448 RepID=UPI00071E7BFB|nr:AI-2E family transporter [Haloparvum sedimenti]
MDEKRFVVTLFGMAVGLAVGYMAFRFVAALTVATFLYYSTRRFHRKLGRLRLPTRVRAMLTLSLVSVPLLLVLTYTVVLMVLELRRFIDQYSLIATSGASVAWIENVGELPEPTFEGIVQAYQAGRFDQVIQFLAENATLLTELVTGFFLNLLVIVVITYYLLVDGGRIRSWLLKFDDDAVVREYLEAADHELEAVLFGNLLNVIAIALIAVASYMGYNVLVPETVQVPYPVLAGVLTGVASLIPVVGMKVVYVPLAAATAAPTLLEGNTELLAYVVGFLVVAVVVVDTIPDLVLRPYLSGETTHVGLLMLAYILGPVVFGFYGLFLAPILLVLAITFAQTALLRLLGEQPAIERLDDAQRQLDEFMPGDQSAD